MPTNFKNSITIIMWICWILIEKENEQAPVMNASSRVRLSNLFGNKYFAVSVATSVTTASHNKE
jgi:hypothetical protein